MNNDHQRQPAQAHDDPEPITPEVDELCHILAQALERINREADGELD